jgi:hypothetical protein
MDHRFELYNQFIHHMSFRHWSLLVVDALSNVLASRRKSYMGTTEQGLQTLLM